MEHASLAAIHAFLARKRIAIVGVSRRPADFSAKLFEEFSRRGYDVVPVNPGVLVVLGRPCFARVQDIQPPVDAVLLMTSPQATDAVVRDCAQVGVRLIWMYRAAGAGAVSPAALQFCREHGIEVIPGECPYMFLPHAAAFHRLHGFLRKLTGHYPRTPAA